MFKRNNLAALAAFSAMMLPQPAFAAGLNGGELSFVWAVPFIGVLLCIAICPLVVPNFWHHHFGKVAVFWALACAVPMFISYGGGVAVNSIAHALIADYIPFIIFVGSLYTVAGAFISVQALSGARRLTLRFWLWALYVPTSWAPPARPCC